jgi:hypothetical protein
MELENFILNEVSQLKKINDHVFLHMWKLDLKAKCICDTYLIMCIYEREKDYINSLSDRMIGVGRGEKC